MAPVIINLDEGSIWKWFNSMVRLGLCHISEGADHLFFLIGLLLPETIFAEHNRWTKFCGIKYSVILLVK